MTADERLARLSPAQRALLQKRLAGEVASAEVAGRHIPPAPRGVDPPASFSQRRMWLLQQMYPEAPPYNSQVALHFDGPLDVGALRRSIDEIVRRHEIYRTTLYEKDGTLLQRIHAPGPAHVRWTDLSTRTGAEREREARRYIDDEIVRPFVLSSLPLVCWSLLRLDPHRHILLCRDHHAVTDGWSRNIVFKELMTLYRGLVADGRLPLLPEPRLQFADFAVWQHQWVAGAEGQAQIEYWKRTLHGSPELLNLPYDRPHPRRPTFRGGHEQMRVGDAELRPLRAVAADTQATMFMAVLAVFYVLLRRYAGSDDIPVGSGIANRRAPDTDGLVGMLINTVVLRADLSGDPTFRELLQRVRRTTLDAYANQEAPFEKVVEALMPGRRMGVNPLHQVTFNFQNHPMPAMDFAGVDVRLERPLFNGSAKFDLYVAGWPRSDARRGDWQRDDRDVLLSWEFNRDVFDEATIRRMQAQFRTLLVDAGTHRDRRVSELRMADEAERLLIDSWSTGVAASEPSRTVHSLFEAHAARTPERTALVAGDVRLTYAELDERADRLAARLRAEGVGPNVAVGLCLPRSADMVVGLLGILKAGGAYLPFDAESEARIVRARAFPQVVVTDWKTGGRLAAAGCRVIAIEGDGDPSVPLDLERPARVDGETLAYVLFTSGSTGEPRAVAVPHRAIVRLVTADFAQMDASQTWLHLSPLAFDASTLEIWAPLCNGGTLSLMPPGSYSIDDIERVIAETGVTSVWLTAGLFDVLVNERLDAFAPLQQILTGGDVVSIPAARKALERFPSLRLVNGYGPTENTTFTTCHTIVGADLVRPRLPIGGPIAGTTIRILDERGDRCPVGVAGEIFAGGAGLALGYANDAAATAAAFIAHPEFGRLYRTGDRGRLMPGGAVDFLGRIDRQVKVRGYRIEPPEIESALRACPAVASAAVDVPGASASDRTIVAYIVPAAGISPRRAVAEIQPILRERLPEYARPQTFRSVSRIPLTGNGKVDYDALRRTATPGRLQARSSRRAPALPRTAMEEAIADIWKDVLERDDIGVHDGFFDVGGHSLAALRVLALLKARTGVALQVLDFFQEPTVARLAACAEKRSLETTGVDGADGFLVELRARGSGQPLFILPGGWGDMGEMLVFAGLLRHLSSDRPMFAVRSRATDRSSTLPRRLDAHARAVMDAIARVTRGGPFVLLAECAASSLALEMAACAGPAGPGPSGVILMDPGPLSHVTTFAERAAQVSTGGGLGPELRALAGRMARSWAVYGPVSAWRDRVRQLVDRDGASAGTISMAGRGRARSVPRAVARYFRLLGSWKPGPPLRCPLHVILSSRFPDADAVRLSWLPLAQGPLAVHQVPGDHDSYIRAHARQTAEVLEQILCTWASSPS